MSQGENDYEKALQRLTSTIGINITEGAKKADSFFSSACIYRVPEELRKVKESAYTPRLIAIGPLHRKDKHLQTPMQQVKMSYTNYLLCRVADGMDAESAKQQRKFAVLQDCLAEIKTSLDDAKKCYAEEVELDEEMMLVDGCFILEVLYKSYQKKIPKEEEKKPFSTEGDNGNSKAAKPTRREKESDEGEIPPQTMLPRGGDGIKGSGRQKPKDPIFGSILTANTVQHDLLLFENQIPFFVLERLFRLTVDQIQIGTNCPRKFSLAYYVSFYFQNLMTPEGNSTNKTAGSPSDCVLCVSGNQMVNSKQEVRGYGNYLHILHKIHENYHPRDQAEKKERNKLMPPASELDYAGIKFVPGTGDDLFEFKFKFTEPKGPFWWCRRACFEIPALGIYDPTESFLRNLIAFEQCLPGVSQHFTSYAFLMDMLVNTDKDVQVLEKAGVVHNYLGASEEAAHLFNKLCKEVALGEFLFAEPCNKAVEYSKRCWPKNMADVRRTYFANPWTFIAFCMAFIAFGITITQFVFLFIYK